MQHNKSIKNRLFQTLGNRSPKHAFLLQQNAATLAPVLRPKQSHETFTPKNGKPLPMFKSGKLLLNPLPAEVIRKKPQEVIQDKLSKEAKSILEEGKNRLRTNLKPHDIFQLYENFPEMLEDFFYLNRASHPYDYQIVTYAQRNPLEYMTISSQGITLYHDKEAEFLTKEQWLIDEKRYYALQRIYFFKQYKLSKNFRIWKNKMRRHYMREMSGILSEHLFLTIRYPRSCLLEVKHLTNTLRDSLNFFPFDTMEKLNQEEFEAIMLEYRQKVLLKAIREITSQIRASLESAVAEEINKFKLENNIKIDGVNEKQHSNKEGYVYSQQAILRKQYKRVYKLIKLADSMLQEAKIEMVLKCLQQLVDKIKELQSEDKQPWITCVATIEESGAITWQPNCGSLCSMFMKTIKGHINAISQNNQKITNSEIFAKYRLADCGETKPQEAKHTFKLMIEDSPNYLVLITQIQDILSNEFQQTEKEEQLLQKFVDIYLRHKELNSMAAIFKENNGVELCNYVEEWKKDQKEMHELSQDKKGRLILYNYSDLRRKIINVPRQTLNCFLSLLPEETLARCKELILESKALFDMISIYPTEIVSFAKFNKAVKQASERLEDIRSSGSEICLLIDLMTKNKLGNIQFYNAKKIQALNSISVLKNKVDESEAKENESLSKFKKDNESEVVKIKTLIKDLAVRFNAIEFNQTKVTAKEMKEVLSKIREILPSINSLEAQSRKIQQIQLDLNLIQTDFNEVHELYQNAKIVNQIWTCRDDWKSMLVNLYHKHYCDVDCVQLKQNWEEFSNKINGLTKVLPENEILKNLTQELGEVEVLIDTIIALRSPNLQEKAWREISEYLAYQLGLENDAQLPFSNIKNPQYTVRWLLEINIPVYKEKIEFIVRKSEKQRELGVHLSEFKTYITNITFDLVSKKREVYLLADNLDIQEKIRLYLAQLYSMLDNQYSQSIKIQAENLIRHYEYIQEIIKAGFEFGSVWSKYESFFDGNSNSLKMLTKESKEFFSWQTQWKKIIKNITSDAVLFYKKVCDETTGVNCSRSMMKQIAKINMTVDQVKKGLDEYLQKKRASFPRYFFIPDEQLLRMLATVDAKEPITQSFVPILYKNIEKILYKEDSKDTLLGIISKQGQEFPLKNISFKLQSQMQDIFKLTEEQIKKKLGYLIKTIFVKYIDEEITRQAMIVENNTQIVLAIDAIAWVRLAEETYLCSEPIGDLYDWIQIQQAQIKEVKTILDSSLSSEHMRYKLMQLMSQSIYQREKTEQLLKNNVTSTECYDWQAIPKLCMNSNNSEVYLKQLSNRLPYCYQFLGNKSVSFIVPATERVWISIAQAIISKEVVCFERYQRGQLQAVKELSYVIAQEVETVHISNNISFKSIERFVNGALFTGNWVCLNQPQNLQALSFLAHQINHIRKAMLDPNLEKSKTYFCNSNVAFFLTMAHKECSIQQLFPSLAHRSVTLSKPSYAKVFSIIADCLCSVPELGTKTVNICEIMRQAFQNNFVLDFNKEFNRQVLEKVIALMPKYDWLKQLKCKEMHEYVICEALDTLLLPLLRKDDARVYENLKNCIVPDYERIKQRHPSPKQQPNADIVRFLDRSHLPFLKKADYLDQLDLLQKAIASSNLGVIIYGEPLSGKSTLIELAARKSQESSGRKIKRHRIYHSAYNRQEIIASDKSFTILTEILNSSSTSNWIIFDGPLSLDYLEMLGSQADKYLIPQIGTFIAKNSKFKFMCETYDVSSLSPSVIGNHSLIYLGDVLSVDVIVRKTFVQLQTKKQLVNLQVETVEWLISGLINLLTKLQNKSMLKAKQIAFVFPLSIWEVTHRCCRIIQAIFLMNWESMREKEKNMKKMVDKFVAWCCYWCLLGLVQTEDQQKLEKFINETYRTDSNSTEELSNCIIYPGCGFQVQPINGLRTQSSLQIPQKGIITNLLRSDLVSEVDHQKGNKFYEQIVISQPHVIRVNYYQSNKFSYISQISFLTDTPILLIGAPNTGKKSLVQLFAKNMRNKTQYYSIRYKNREHLGTQIQRPFRKLIALEGVIMKSTNASNKLYISIEDVSLKMENRDTGELLRMIFNEKGYYGKQAQWMRLSNCCFSLIATKLAASPDNLRLISKMALFQTANSVDKLHSIFSPYLKNWSAFNGLSGEVQRIFNSQNGDTLLDATLSVFKLMEQLHKNDAEKGSLERLLIRPGIGDITKVLTYICKTPEANHYNLTYYYELWAHEVVRVFGDRLASSRQRQQLFKEIKKESLVKFKENFTLSYENMFNFTSLGIENQNCYIRIEDPSFLHTYISNLLEADQINLPLKFLFDELLENLIKIYRVLTVQGGHLLLLCHNSVTAKYLIQLACQVGQNDYFQLNGSCLSVQKHIQPTLYYKDNICVTEDIDALDKETTYQIACLLNYNIYDFSLKPELKEKVKLSLNKKEKIEIQKKQSKAFSKTKTEQVKTEQREEDIQTLMGQQFMNFAHFIFYARPTSLKLKDFVAKENDIIGQLHFNWIDIPKESILKVAKQILSFDTQTSQLILSSHNNDSLIQKVRAIYDKNPEEDRYFNDILIISELVKTQTLRLSAPLTQRQKEIKSSKEIYLKVIDQIKQKEEKMKGLQEEIEEINGQLQEKCRQLQEVNNKITEWQMNINNEETSNGQALSELRVEREEIEIELKLIKEKKDQLESEKKKILKSIKIASDYLEIFDNSLATFDKKEEVIQARIDLLQDKLIIVWSIVSYMLKKSPKECLSKANAWRELINSKLPQLENQLALLELIQEVSPIKLSRSEFFSPSLKAKFELLLLVLFNYEETAFFGRVVRVYDPKGMLPVILQHMTTEDTVNYSLLKTFPNALRQNRVEIQALCKMKNGLILVQSDKDVRELQLNLVQKKMGGYLNKIIVLTDQKSCNISLECDQQQLHLCVENLILKQVNLGMYQQKVVMSQDLVKEMKKKEENQDLFCKASANLNIETETYTQQLNKYKNLLTTIQQSIRNIKMHIQAKKYLQLAEFDMLQHIYAAVLPFLNRKELTLKHLGFVFHQSIYFKNSSEFQQNSMEEKGQLLMKMVEINITEGDDRLETQLKFAKKWDSRARLYILKPCKKMLQQLQLSKEYKLVNLLACNNMIAQINESSNYLKIMYNFSPSLHLSMLNEIIEIQTNDTNERIVPLIIMAESSLFQEIDSKRAKIIQVELEQQLVKEVEKDYKIKWQQNVRKYIQNMTKNKEHTSALMSSIERYSELAKNQEDSLKLIKDIIPSLSAPTINHLFNLSQNDIEPYIYSTPTSESKERRATQVTKNCEELSSVKEELPFIFNVAEFLPSKDPLANQLIAECVLFNKKLKDIKDKLKEIQFDWEQIDRSIPNSKLIQSLNNEYQALRKNLIKLHLIANNANTANFKSASHKTFSSGNILFQSTLRLPKNMLSHKILSVLKCKAAKKFKSKFSNIHLLWKLCLPCFSFEENGTFPQLCTIVEGSLYNGAVLQGNWNSGVESLKKIELIGYMVESANQPKTNPQSLYIPIFNQSAKLGFLEVCKSELSNEYIIGLESPEIHIQQPETS